MPADDWLARGGDAEAAAVPTGSVRGFCAGLARPRSHEASGREGPEFPRLFAHVDFIVHAGGVGGRHVLRPHALRERAPRANRALLD